MDNLFIKKWYSMTPVQQELYFQRIYYTDPEKRELILAEKRRLSTVFKR